MTKTKEFKRTESKLSKELQEAYIKTCMVKYEEELSHVVTEAEATVFKARWSEIADKLADGYILDIESI